MKKKLLYGLIVPLVAILVIGVSASAVYYVFFSASFNVNNIDGMGTFQDDIVGDFEFGDVIVGKTRILGNDLENDRNILITTSLGDENIGVEYKSTLELTKKDVDFGLDSWVIPADAEKVQVEYTIVGDEFSAEVVEGLNENYVLIYYADAEDRFANPEEAILIENVEGNLPNIGDANAVNDYSEEYVTSHGAKIWYVPSDAILNGVIDWTRASDFYFESKLIQYNSDGEITFYSGDSLDIIPEYTPDEFAEGDYTIETTIA